MDRMMDNKQSYEWLKFLEVKGERKSTRVETQDQAISKNYF
jgi:hypothetical protein